MKVIKVIGTLVFILIFYFIFITIVMIMVFRDMFLPPKERILTKKDIINLFGVKNGKPD